MRYTYIQIAMEFASFYPAILPIKLRLGFVVCEFLKTLFHVNQAGKEVIKEGSLRTKFPIYTFYSLFWQLWLYFMYTLCPFLGSKIK